MDSRSIVRSFLLSLLASGSVSFLFLNVSQLIDEKTSGLSPESTERVRIDDSME